MGIICKVCFFGKHLWSHFRLMFFVFSWVSLSLFCTYLIQEAIRDLRKWFKDSAPPSPPLPTHSFLRFPTLFRIYGFLASLFWFSRLGRPWVFMHVSLSPLYETRWMEFSSGRKPCRLTYWYNCSLFFLGLLCTSERGCLCLFSSIFEELVFALCSRFMVVFCSELIQQGLR